MIENIENTIPKPEEFPEKYLELDEKSSRFPVPKEVWEEVIELAKKEEAEESINKGSYKNIPLDDLLDLAKNVKAEDNPIKRYELLATKSPDGRIWFDVLNGLHSPSAQEELAKVVSKKSWDKALDLGTGTGEMTDKIRKHCSELICVDRVKLLLDVAKEREEERRNYVLADALKSPFKKDSFELVISGGLMASFTKEESKKFIDELKLIIKPGGSYMESFLYSNKNLDIDSRKRLNSAKSILADMVVDEVSGKAKNKDGFSIVEMINYFKKAGFREYIHSNNAETKGVLEFIKN